MRRRRVSEANLKVVRFGEKHKETGERCTVRRVSEANLEVVRFGEKHKETGVRCGVRRPRSGWSMSVSEETARCAVGAE